ncbi:MAG: NAD(P)H-hydrate dehydratase, partial [Chloroflexota bacterium]
QQPHSIIGLIGSGNNGGDTHVALEYLAKRAWICIAYLVKERIEGDIYLARFMKAGGTVIHVTDDQDFKIFSGILSHCVIILDGIFGTGIKQPLEDDLSSVLYHIKANITESSLKYEIIAVDCPSGLDCDTGDVSESCIPADYTACMGAVKQGILKFPGVKYTGNLIGIDIGFPKDFPSIDQKLTFMIDDNYVQKHLPKRPRDAHKGTFGTCVIFAGSEEYIGAAYLSGKAAYFSGAGLVHILVHPKVHRALAGNFPEAIWSIFSQETLNDENKLTRSLIKIQKNCDALLLGPGIGYSVYSNNLVKLLLLDTIKLKIESENKTRNTYPLIIDADGLRLLSKFDRWWEMLPKNSVLTPHPGEMAALTGLNINEIQSDRWNLAKHYAQYWDVNIVLKGAITVVANPNGVLAVIPIASPALATAGTGDILAGLITGFCAQGVDAFEASALAAYIHGQAGKIAERKFGQSVSVTANEVLSFLPEIISQIINKQTAYF